MKRNTITIATAITVAIFFFMIGRYSKPSPEPVVKYIELPPIVVEKDSSELRPILAKIPDSIVYITVYRDRPESGEFGPTERPQPPVIDTMASYLATIEDWNIKRIYQETLIDSDTLGHATLTATVQYNKLTGLNFHYNPIQRQETVISTGKRLEGYGLMNVTNSNSSLGLGVKFGRVGVHAIGGYDYKGSTFVYGAGMMVTF